MALVERIPIFLASPGDVGKERRIVEEIVAELNRTVTPGLGIILQVVRWESDAFPGYGADAQAIINAQIAEMGKYALFVGIMWNRLGTPTPRSESGTVEEFERAVEAFARHGRPDIWFYFRQSAATLDTDEQIEQRKKVLAFRKRVQANGLPWTYKSPADFQKIFRNQLTLWLSARSTRTGSPVPVPALPTKNATQEIDPWSEIKEDLISKGGILYSDPWTQAGSVEELEFKQLLKGRLKEGFEYMERDWYEELIELWKPMAGNAFFRVDHPEWEDKPFFRCQIHMAKCQLFIAYAQLGNRGDYETYVPPAFRMLQEVLQGNPYSMKGAASDRLSTEDARTQNLNYQDTLNLAVEWLHSWSGSVIQSFGFTASEAGNVEKRVGQRLSEIDYLLHLRSD